MRILLVALLGIAVADLAVLPERPALLLALLIMLLAFLFAGAKLAVDLIELVAVELAADAAVFVVLGFALTRITSASRPLIAALIAAALVAELLPFAVGRLRLRAG